MSAAPRTIVLATGGTGGHIFPAQALAGGLRTHGYRIAVVTDRRAKAMSGSLGDADVFRISGAGVSGRSVLNRISAVFQLGVGYLQARRILRKLSPAVAVGFGSYASLPTMLAAVHLSIPTVIHEQNAILGRSNRLLASRVTRIATAFEAVMGVRPEDHDKTAWTGNPVRAAVLAIADRPYPSIEGDGALNILVFGGSLGASIFSEVVPETIAALPENLRSRIRLVQQCRAEDIERVRHVYAARNIDAELAPFFEDMPDRLAAAHLVISRSGASTIAELTAAGRPAILVPFQHATDDHQTKNAQGLCDAGGGWLIPQSTFDRDSLTARLTALLANTKMLRTAAGCAGRIGARDATEKLTSLVAGVLDDSPARSSLNERRAAV
jgi:UDP-N-acetylglucosamine--N-acetylmuramyl-(pentapeptide) pyrophosphoryl-undecaprenol N-acetylglucosamine transferase